jgi:hypothetical protein
MPSRSQTAATLAGLFSTHLVSAQSDASYSSGALGAGPYSTFVSTNATPPLWNHVLPINDTIKPQLTSGLIFGESAGIHPLRSVRTLMIGSTFQLDPEAPLLIKLHRISTIRQES